WAFREMGRSGLRQPAIVGQSRSCRKAVRAKAFYRVGGRLPEGEISPGQPGQSGQPGEDAQDDAQDDVQSAGNTPQLPQSSLMDCAQFVVLLASRREQ